MSFSLKQLLLSLSLPLVALLPSIITHQLELCPFSIVSRYSFADFTTTVAANGNACLFLNLLLGTADAFTFNDDDMLH